MYTNSAGKSSGGEIFITFFLQQQLLQTKHHWKNWKGARGENDTVWKII